MNQKNHNIIHALESRLDLWWGQKENEWKIKCFIILNHCIFIERESQLNSF